MSEIEQNLSKLLQALEPYPQPVRLLAVSKTKPASLIEQAYQVGQRAFGENYVQEACEKIIALKHLHDIEWHYIGPIQSNKCKAIAEHFHWVQSVDRLKIAEALNKHCPANKRLNICVQVNIDNEPQKAGIAPEHLFELCDAIMELAHLELRGLMAIPKAGKSVSEQHASFARIAELFRDMQARYASEKIDTLSMGMSDDYPIALQQGATMIRIGSAIFGERI